MEEFKEKQIIADGQLVTYYEHEGGNNFLPTLVLLHGWRSSSEAWEPTLRYFKEAGHRMVLIDLPGFGKSEAPKRTFSVEDYMGVVRDVLRQLSLVNSVVVAHSFGGRIAIKLSALHPESLWKVVLTGSAGIKHTSVKKKSIGFIAKLLKPVFALPFLSGVRKKIYRTIGSEDYIATPELRDTFVKIVEEDLTPLVRHISVDTLIIWGREDEATPLEDGKYLHVLIPHSKFVILDEAGHYSFQDKPRRFAEEVIEFSKAAHEEMPHFV